MRKFLRKRKAEIRRQSSDEQGAEEEISELVGRAMKQYAKKAGTEIIS